MEKWEGMDKKRTSGKVAFDSLLLLGSLRIGNIYGENCVKYQRWENLAL